MLYNFLTPSETPPVVLLPPRKFTIFFSTPWNFLWGPYPHRKYLHLSEPSSEIWIFFPNSFGIDVSAYTMGIHCSLRRRRLVRAGEEKSSSRKRLPK